MLTKWTGVQWKVIDETKFPNSQFLVDLFHLGKFWVVALNLICMSVCLHCSRRYSCGRHDCTSQISLMWCSYFTDLLYLKKFNRQLISIFSLLVWKHHNKLPMIGSRTITMPSLNFSCFTFSLLSKEKSAFGTLKHNASFGIAWQRIIGIMNVWFFYPIYKPHGIMQPFSLVVAIITTLCHSAMFFRFREGKTFVQFRRLVSDTSFERHK